MTSSFEFSYEVTIESWLEEVRRGVEKCCCPASASGNLTLGVGTVAVGGEQPLGRSRTNLPAYRFLNLTEGADPEPDKVMISVESTAEGTRLSVYFYSESRSQEIDSLSKKWIGKLNEIKLMAES